MKKIPVDDWRKGVFDIEPKYYVYEWYNTDTNYVFYVGKGSGDRVRAKAPTKRNKYFVSYVNAHPTDYRILKDGLTEKEAFDLEEKIISEKRCKGECCCNFDDGGGICAPHLKGELNPMYGKTHSEQAVAKIREANRNGRNAGCNNNQFGITSRQRMSEEKYTQWKKAHSKCPIPKNLCGKKYSVHVVKSQTGEIVETFKTVKETIEKFLSQFREFDNTTDGSLRVFIAKHNSPDNDYKGYYFQGFFPNPDTAMPSLPEEGSTTIESVLKEKDF